MNTEQPRAQQLEAHVEEAAAEAPVEPSPPAPLVKHDIPLVTLLKVVAVGAAVWLLIELRNVILLACLSLMVVATFQPLVKWLTRYTSRRWALATAILALLALVVVPLVLVAPIVYNQGANLVQHLPDYAASLEALASRHRLHLNIQKQVAQLTSSMTNGLPQLMYVVSSVLEHVAALLTVLVLSIYLLIEGPQVGTGALRLLPRERRLGVRNMVSDVGQQVGGYVRGQLILSTLACLVFMGILFALGVPNAVALGVIAGVVDAIPLIGVLIALVPACLTALTVSSLKAGAVAVIYLGYHQIEANILTPRVYKHTLGLSFSVIILSLAIGFELLGVLGALLALPVAAMVPVLVRYLQALQGEDDDGRPAPMPLPDATPTPA